jgi:hypothetical protein
VCIHITIRHFEQFFLHISLLNHTYLKYTLKSFIHLHLWNQT